MSEKIAAGKAEKEAKAEVNDVSASRIQVSRSLRRSKVRTEVAMYLYKIYPGASYPADICRNIGITPTNILGALRGMGSRFDKSNSLIERGVVEKVELEDATYYRLSERGKLLIESLGMGGR